MRFVNRAVGAASRRLGRPEWLAVVSAAARQAQQDAIGMNAVLAAGLRGEGTYVDIGTNRGQVLREAIRIAPRGRHVAFEPIPSLAAELARTFPDVDCRTKALGARAETTEFCHYRALDGWSGLRRRPEISDSRGEPELITVEVSTLDAEMAGIDPDVVKIDVEGAEVAVLEGARAVLSRARPLVLFEHSYAAAALYGAQPGAPWEVLTDLDYEIFSVTGEGPFNRSQFIQSGDVVNWLATPLASAAESPTA
jgi:FkbM family methyltransferase